MCVLDLTLVSFSCNIKANQLLRPFSNRHLPSLTKSYERAGLQWRSWDHSDPQQPRGTHKCWILDGGSNRALHSLTDVQHPIQTFNDLTSTKVPDISQWQILQDELKRRNQISTRMWLVLRLEPVNSNLLSRTKWIMMAVSPWQSLTPSCIVMVKASKMGHQLHLLVVVSLWDGIPKWKYMDLGFVKTCIFMLKVLILNQLPMPQSPCLPTG